MRKRRRHRAFSSKCYRAAVMETKCKFSHKTAAPQGKPKAKDSTKRKLWGRCRNWRCPCRCFKFVFPSLIRGSMPRFPRQTFDHYLFASRSPVSFHTGGGPRPGAQTLIFCPRALFFRTPSSHSRRVRLGLVSKRDARSRVRAGSAAQRQAAQLGQAQDLAQVRCISVCRARPYWTATESRRQLRYAHGGARMLASES